MCDLTPWDYVIRDVQSSLEFWRPMTLQHYLKVGLYGFGQFRHPEIKEELEEFKRTFNIRKTWIGVDKEELMGE
jgi:hypothetical protein